MCLDFTSVLQSSATIYSPTQLARILPRPFFFLSAVVKIQVRKRIRRKTETKLRTLKKKRIFKRVNISKKELRKALFYMDGGETCQCDELDAVGTPGKRHYLAMGQKRDGKLRLSFLRLMDKKNKEFQKAVRKIRRNEDICKGGVQMLTDDDAAEAAKKQKRRRDRKARRARKDGKRNGQRKDGKRNNGERKSRRRKPKNGETQREQPT
ncbi:hypothetical protein NP493_910g00034 [Ridgeia piscesae]|uniref:Uncharacterized protein n=1 Tax=Ridgeia piscesae TaxID=27915 RepID=A0AAD9NLS7_RIDPI|nr:hypothetical protein NP493_910g00034 [Ridgeia piscesae]